MYRLTLHGKYQVGTSVTSIKKVGSSDVSSIEKGSIWGKSVDVARSCGRWKRQLIIPCTYNNACNN